METSLVAPYYPLKILPTISLKRSLTHFPIFLIALIKSIFLSLSFLLKEHPSVVVGMGGYPSFPTLIAAAILRIPIVIHEQNIIPGRVNKFLAPLARRVLISFPETASFFPSSHTKLVGLPIRASLKKIDKLSARRELRLDPSAPTILVSGGSRGALAINNAIVEILPYLLMEGKQVIHLCGSAHYQQFRERTQNINNRYLLLPFASEMHLLYSASDLCVSRAGASTLAELAYFSLPSILIPYPYAISEHQFINALLFKKKGASRVLLNETLSEPRRLFEEISALLSSPQELERMSISASSLSRLKAAEEAAEEIKEVMRK